MGRHEDKLFMKRFSLVIAALVVVTIVIIAIAATYDKGDVNEDYPSRLAMQAERVQPVGAVRTELPADVTAEPASQMTGVEDTGIQVALEPTAAAGDIDGARIYVTVCQACHISGAAGAPIPGTDAWAERVAKGAEILYANAINGINAMPAKGGRMDLSDDEVKAAVDHMLTP